MKLGASSVPATIDGVAPPVSAINRRISRLMRNLALSGAIGLGMIAGGAAVYLAGEAYYKSRESAKTQLKNQISGITSQTGQMELDAKEAKDAIALNEALHNSIQSNDLSLSRDILTQRIGQLSEEFFLEEVGVTASGVRDVTLNPLTLAGGKEISMLVDLDISAASDAQIYRFMDALPAAVPGYVEMMAFTMEKEGTLRPEMLLALAQGVKSGLVKAKITFVWHGIKPNPPAADPNAAAAPGMPPMGGGR